MGAQSERQAIGKVFFDSWELGSNLPVAIPNKTYDKLSNGTETWVRFSIKTDDSFPIEIEKNGYKRNIGMVFLDVFDVEGAGDARALGYADEIAGIFRDQEVSVGTNGRILFRTPKITDIGQSLDSWYHVQVSVPFVRDESFGGES